MKKETRDYITIEVNSLLKIDFACKEAKEAANNWLKVAGTSEEDAEALKMIKEFKEDVEPIDDLVKFANSKHCEEAFGVKGAEGFRKHANELKESGAKYCDCPACTACLNVIKKEKEFK